MSAWLLFLLYFVPAVAVPGPNAMLAVAIGMFGSRFHVFLCAIGFALGSLIHTFVLYLSAVSFMQTIEGVLIAIRFVGICFILYLAVQMWFLPLSPLSFQRKLTSQLNPIKVLSLPLLVSTTNIKGYAVTFLIYPIFLKSNGFGLSITEIGVAASATVFTVYFCYGLCATYVQEKFMKNLGLRKFSRIASVSFVAVAFVMIFRVLI